MLTRRQSIKALTLGPLALAAMPHSLAQAKLNPLPIPPLDQGQLTDRSRAFDLTLRRGNRRFLPETETETLGINGDYLGPTLRFRRLEDVALTVHNHCGEDSTLHWHGFHLPAAEDGGPHQTVADGASWTARYPIVQFPGTYWYHSHMLHSSGAQVYRGLAGLIIIEDEQAESGLPQQYGVDDIPLIVQDRRFNEDGSFDYMSRYEDRVMGMQGDTILVNGATRTSFQATTQLVRFRILNASNARTFNFAFANEREFRQVACDGGLLERPVSLTRLVLAPAERAEIVVDVSDGREALLQSRGFPATFSQFPGAMSRMMRSLNTQDFDILTIRPAAQLRPSPALSERFDSIYRLPEAAATNTRPMLLSMGAGMRSGGDAGPGTGTRMGTGGGYGGGNYYINGRRMSMDFINERITLNTTEIWELSNNSPMMHPFHVHNGQFQLLDRNGQPPPANEMGWKDTVRVESGELVRIIMRFTDYVDPANPYMYHCHILEHEDRGMMGQFVLV